MFERTRSLWHRLTGTSSIAEDDRRAWRRFLFDRTTFVRADDAAEPLTARIQDVSRGGLRLLVDQPLENGAMIRVELPLRAGSPTASILACVVHHSAVGAAEWSVGCSFALELNDGDLQALGVQPQERDQRTWERVPVSGHATYQPASGGESHSAAIHNVSPTGVALRLKQRAEPGTLYSLEMRNAASAAAVSILACVVYISEVAADEWLAGCNFIRELDDDELRKLI